MSSLQLLAIRPLAVADAPALAALLQRQAPEYAQHFQPFTFTEEAVRAELTAAGRDFYGALEWEGALAGFFMLRGLQAGYARPAFGVLVAQEFSGRGLAGAALRWSIAWCREQGIPALMLTVHPENTRAARLYEEAGFRPTGQLSAKGHEIWECTV